MPWVFLCDAMHQCIGALVEGRYLLNYSYLKLPRVTIYTITFRSS